MSEQTNPQAALAAAAVFYAASNTNDWRTSSQTVVGTAEKFLTWLDEADKRQQPNLEK